MTEPPDRPPLLSERRAAELLGISKRVMNYKIKMHGIQNKRWRKPE